MKVFQKWILFLLVVMHFSVYAENVPPDIQRILKRGTLIVAVLQQDFPPFHWHDSTGALTGYDVKMAEDIAQRLGVKVAFNAKATKLSELADEVAQGQADMIVSYNITPKRAEEVIYSKPQLLFNQVLLVNNLTMSKNNWPLDPMVILKKPNITVGTLEDSNFVEILKSKYPNATIVTYQNIEQAFQDVKDGKIQMVFYVDKLIDRWLNQHPEANLYTRELTLTNRMMPMGMAVAWRDIYFMHWLNAYIIMIETDGTLANLKNTFFGDGT